jgi:hypothetical protein
MSNYTSCVQLRSKSIIVYNKFERSFSLRTDKQLISDKKLKDQETYVGRLCPGGKKRLIKAIELITQAGFETKQFTYTPKGALKEVKAKFKLNFITLTIHSPAKMIAGKEGHTLCLEPLLKWMRDNYGLSMYVWKAELQQRGQLHYHITSNCYIPWHDLWEKWGELNERAGYLKDWFSTQSRYKVNSKGEFEINYPVAGTDIHSVYKVSDMAKYMQKCICKTTKRKDGTIISEFKKEVQNAASVGGKVWDCSLNLKSAKHYTIDCGGSIGEQIINNVYREAKKPGNKMFVSDNCTIFTFTNSAYKVLDEFWQEDYFDSLKKMIRYQRTGKIADPTVFSSS